MSRTYRGKFAIKEKADQSTCRLQSPLAKLRARPRDSGIGVGDDQADTAAHAPPPEGDILLGLAPPPILGELAFVSDYEAFSLIVGIFSR